LIVDGEGSVKSSESNEDFILISQSFGSKAQKNAEGYFVRKPFPGKSTLKKDLIFIKSIYDSCHICINNCRVNRKYRMGKCKSRFHKNVYLAQTEYEEEKIISPSYMIYLNGCNLQCNYCHQKEWMNIENISYWVSYSRILKDIRENEKSIRSISFLGGNPEQSILTFFELVELLIESNIKVPLVWNTNLTCNSFVIDILNQYIDVYLVDIKFGNNLCAKEISGAKSYWENILLNLDLIKSDNPIIVRHLPLPQHFECCTLPILHLIKDFRFPYQLSLLESLYDDNSKEIQKALIAAKNLKITNHIEGDFDGFDS